MVRCFITCHQFHSELVFEEENFDNEQGLDCHPANAMQN